MKKTTLFVFVIAIIISLSTSCVTKKKFEEMQAVKNKQISSLQKDVKGKTEEVKQLNSNLNKTVEEYNEMKNNMMESNARKTAAIDSLNNAVMGLSSDKSQLDVQLKKAIRLYEEEKNNMQGLSRTLEEQNKLLAEKQKRLAELEGMIETNKAEANRLKNTLTEALTAYGNDGLSVHQKDGKIYVSLSEQLLFAVGSANVDPKGKKALIDLAKVLEKNPEIDITIEGHTDNVGDIYYNWELSSKRALAIVEILQKNSKVNPARFTASGRGMYVPIDETDSKEAKQKNRRTEIILTPKLDILYKLLDENISK